MDRDLVRLSKRMSWALRHAPDEAGIILAVAAAEMGAAGHAFYLSANGVWLTDAVPPGFISRHA
jgi:putative RNA 2'-phosphotransferase